MTTLSAEDRRLLGLAAVFAPERATALLSLLVTEGSEALGNAAARAAGGARGDRLALLGAVLGPPAALYGAGPSGASTLALARLLRETDAAGPNGGPRSGPRTSPGPERPALAPACPGTPRELGSCVALPFDTVAISLGYALLGPAARRLGAAAASEASRALGELTAGEVAVRGRPLPCVPVSSAGCVRLRVELAALPGTAAVEVHAPLAVALLDRLSGGAGRPEPATSATPLERSALELAALTALRAVATLPEVEERLAPRLARAACDPPPGGLAVDLAISLGAHAGKATLILPAAAVRALAATGAGVPSATADAVLDLSLRSGAAPLSPGELGALEPGDVVLIDPLPAGRLHAVAPGGLRFAGAEAHDTLTIEEVRMPDAAPASMDYPVALEVELARVPVTLGELLRLEPGAILPLPVDRRGLVTLKLGDVTFGRGQLVDVDGAVGVRLDTLAAVHR